MKDFIIRHANTDALRKLNDRNECIDVLEGTN